MNQPGVEVGVLYVGVRAGVRVSGAPMMVTEGLRRRLGWEHSIVHAANMDRYRAQWP